MLKISRESTLVSLAIIFGYITLLRSVVNLLIPQFSSLFIVATRYFSILSWLFFVLSFISLKRSRNTSFTKQFDRFFYVLQIITLLLVIYGFIRHNDSKYIISQYIGLSSVIMFFSLSRFQKIYEHSLKLLTYIFYLNIILMFFTKDMVSISRFGDQYYNINADERLTGTVAFTLRSIVSLGFFLTAYAVNTKGHKLMRILQFTAILFVFYFEVYMFQFRSILIEIVLFLLGIIYIKTNARIKLTLLVSGLLIGIVVLFGSEDLKKLGVMNRFERGGGLINAIEEGRNEEAVIMLKQFKVEDYLFGRGISGSFNASDIYGKNGTVWRGTHYGILIFLLNGGIVYLALFIYILLISTKNWIQKHKQIHLSENPVIKAAWLTFPTILFSIVFNPLGWSQGVVIGYMLSLFSLGLAFIGFEVLEPNEVYQGVI